MQTKNIDTKPGKRGDEPHIDNNAHTNKSNTGIPVFLLQETLTFEQAVAYLDTYSEPEADEQCIIIGFLSDVVDVETAVEICAMQTVVRIVKDELKREKDDLKPEKKQSWSKKTTWDKIEKKVNKIFNQEIGERELFEIILSLVLEFSETYGPPYLYGGRGPHLQYRPEYVAAILIMKAALGVGNGKIIKKVEELGIDARISVKARYKVPRETHLRNIIKREEFLDWLDEFIAWLVLEKAEVFLRFFIAREFVLDGTDMKTNRLEKVIKGGEGSLKKETIEVKFLFNINIDMYVYAELTTSHNAREAIERLSPGDVLLADPEFFTRENCELILAKGIKPAIKPTKNARKGPVIRLCRKAFEKRRYRRRKNGERGAKIYDSSTMLYLDPERQRGVVKLMAAAYNVKRLVKLVIKYTVVMRLVMFLN